jgi:hypothetical protein
LFSFVLLFLLCILRLFFLFLLFVVQSASYRRLWGQSKASWIFVSRFKSKRVLSWLVQLFILVLEILSADQTCELLVGVLGEGWLSIFLFLSNAVFDSNVFCVRLESLWHCDFVDAAKCSFFHKHDCALWFCQTH